MHEVFVANHGAVYENGNVVNKQAAGEWQDVAYLGANSIDWMQPGELGNAWIIGDNPAERARWPAPGSPPTPVGIFSIVAKSAEPLDFESSAGFAADYRNRTWLHAPPTRLANFLMNPQDLNRADSPYQIHFRPVNSDQEVSLFLQADGPLGYFGGGYTAAQGQTHVTALSIPTAPATNLGSLAGVRIDHGRARFNSDGRYNNIKHLAHAGGAFGVGIGNSYAHPMIRPNVVYTRNDFGRDNGWNGTRASNLNVTDDYWDHLFLANEELWDSWFFSGITPAVNNGVVNRTKRLVAQDFFSGQPTHISPHMQPELNGKTPGELADLVETHTATSGENGWDRIAPYLLNRGQFNVNSTSKEAWKALFMCLADRRVATLQPGAAPRVAAHNEADVILTRHALANSETAANGPGDDHAWRGIRNLTEAEIDKLAEETVRQVKLRGPFLNMTEFINRRLSNDEFGVTGALQAAIDWDEFNAGYDGTTSGSGASINAAYKTTDAMITRLPANYPNERAARGSRYAGIPGYVMQSDILQGISSSLGVRGDTFLVRAYGESLARDGSVAARAWCEAVVQRMPRFTNPEDDFSQKMRDPRRAASDLSSLHPENRTYGRVFQITSFRWLSSNEI